MFTHINGDLVGNDRVRRGLGHMTFAGLRGDDVIHVNALSPNKPGNQQDIIVYLSSSSPPPCSSSGLVPPGV